MKIVLPPIGSNARLLLCVFVASLCVGWINHFCRFTPFTNDEAVELIQATGMRLDRFHFFATGDLYPDGHVDRIESAVPYVNYFLAGLFPITKSQSIYIASVRLYYVVAFALACTAFSYAVLQIYGIQFGILAAILMMSSSLLFVVNHTLTRNGISILWAALALLAVIQTRTAKTGARQSWRWIGAFSLPFVLVLGCWTYTSFRLLAAALFFGIGLSWIRYDRHWKSVLQIGLSGLSFALMLYLLVVAGGSTLTDFLDRGSYAIASWNEYGARLFLALTSPWNYSEDGRLFLVDDVHRLMGRCVLSPLLGAFFVVGLISSCVGRDRSSFLVAISWIVGMVLCAIAGPNVKYLFAFFPLTLFLTVVGIRMLSGLADSLNPFVVRASFAGLLACSILGEMVHVFVVSPKFGVNEQNLAAAKFAQLSQSYAMKDLPWLAVINGFGTDITTWHLRPFKAKNNNIFVFLNAEELKAAIEKSPPPVGAVILTAMRREEAQALVENLKIPNEVKVISAEDASAQ